MVGYILSYGVATGQTSSDIQFDKSLVKLHILHINDFHGAVEPFLDPEISRDSKTGGIACLKTLIDRERERDIAGTIVLNAGDIAEGTMISYYFQRKSCYRCF
jgi:2',3'-cyclic-nucleotide 2'-phosphodiesterase (5'-nucleotidase family)